MCSQWKTEEGHGAETREQDHEAAPTGKLDYFILMSYFFFIRSDPQDT